MTRYFPLATCLRIIACCSSVVLWVVKPLSGVGIISRMSCAARLALSSESVRGFGACAAVRPFSMPCSMGCRIFDAKPVLPARPFRRQLLHQR